MTKNEKIEKAIEWQKLFKKTYNGMPEEVNEMCDLAIEALQKQIAKRPIGISVNEDGHRIGNCPNCKKFIVNICNEKVCDCGQKLDWNGVD